MLLKVDRAPLPSVNITVQEDLNVFAKNNPFVLKENMKGLRMYDSCENNKGLLLLVRSSKGPHS